MDLINKIRKIKDKLHPIIPEEYKSAKAVYINLSRTNKELFTIDISDPENFNEYILRKIGSDRKSFGYGGYMEDRPMYGHHELFRNRGNARCIHLGIDIWLKQGNAIYLPLEGRIHSYRNNRGQSNYGPTVITEHILAGKHFYLLFGHLSSDSLLNIEPGKYLEKGHRIGYIGNMVENGNWPPHLHFQIITDLLGHSGDFPGVCEASETEFYRKLCPDPGVFFNFVV